MIKPLPIHANADKGKACVMKYIVAEFTTIPQSGSNELSPSR